MRASSVGRDLQGYREVYLLTNNIPFNDFSYVYFEKGYIFLMKICVVMKLPFQGFLAFVYAIVMIPIFTFICHNSQNKLFSVLIYVCYINFEMSLSALRQAISVSIVLLAFDVLLNCRKRKLSALLSVGLVFLAATFHTSAIVVIPFFFLSGVIQSVVRYVCVLAIGTVFGMFGRIYIFDLLKNLFKDEVINFNGEIHIGGNIEFMCAITIGCLVLYYKAKENTKFNLKKNSFLLKAYLFGIIVLLFFGDANASRSYLFFGITGTVLIPNFIANFKLRNKIITESGFVIFLAAFFYFKTLKANNLDIVPYQFFWNELGK